MSIWTRNLDQHLIIEPGMSDDAIRDEVSQIDASLRCDFGLKGVAYLEDSEGCTFPNGEMSSREIEEIEKIVALFAPGSYVTYYDEDDGVYYDCRRKEDGSIEWRHVCPDRDDLFGKD